MRVVVTGVAGFVGSHLAEALLARGDEVVGIDAFIDYYPRALKERNLRAVRDHPAFTFHEIDLRRDPLDAALEGADAVINEAAMAGLDRSWTDVESYAGCNIMGVSRLIEASRRAGIKRFVQASTSSVYGRTALGDETMPTRPISPYGVTKLAAEHLIQAFVQTADFPAVILRYFSIYGPRQRPDMAYRIFIEALLDNRPITIYGDGEQSRSNTYVGDCVEATIGALDGGEIGEVYNIGGGEEITLNDALAVISDALGVEPVVERQPARSGDQRRTWADTSKAAAAFAYNPKVPPTAGLRLQVAWQAGERASDGPEAKE